MADGGTYYHVLRSDRVADALRDGLEGREEIDGKRHVYLWDNLPSAERYREALAEDFPGAEHAILRVRLQEGIPREPWRTYGIPGAVSTDADRIPPADIRVERSGDRGNMVIQRGEVDEVAARELVLWIDNDASLFHQQHEPILKNLMRKRAIGTYDHEKAVKLFGYLAENGAKNYAKEFASPGDWNTMFTKPTRDAAASQLTAQFEAEAATGALDSLIPKKYREKEVRGSWEYDAGAMPGEPLEELMVEGKKGGVAAIVEDDTGGGVGDPARPFRAVLPGGRTVGAFRDVPAARRAAEKALGYRIIHVGSYQRDRNGRTESVTDHDRRQLVRTDAGSEPRFEALKRRRRP